MSDDEICSHSWVSNSGRGGDPQFRPNKQLSFAPAMHVRCSKCNSRTWFNEKQWNELAERAKRLKS